MDSGETGMNPVAMTIVDPQKEYWPSRRFEPVTCSEVFFATHRTTAAWQSQQVAENQPKNIVRQNVYRCS